MNGEEVQRLSAVEVSVGKLETSTEAVENRLTKIETKMDDLMTNHIPHLKQEIQANKYKIAIITGSAAFIGSKLVDFLFK